jgi:hypothetical protein
VRAFSETAYRGLKSICAVAYDVVGGSTLFQTRTRVVVSQLSKYASFKEEDEKSFMPIDVAIDLDRMAQSPIITGHMAAALGYRLEPLRDALSCEDILSERDAHRVLSEAMDVSRELLAAFADGKLDALERKRLRTEIRELIRAAEWVLCKIDEAGA